ncbi:FtsK/SpoIIIE domain-containing protein [Microbacterium resistens]|uniref:FtsK/SpoIIIE domain-containing protein n=1 Tax=Microbacterium resistens TaxID=156977 RepID=UPI0008321101|nr:FtsK/SpoIIIE domain-containing protein [Microbacterium resistens]
MDPVEPLLLPAAPAPPRRTPLPVVAALVPVASGTTLWALTGSMLSLAFAALGPLMLLASFVDAARHRRRDARRARIEQDEAWTRVQREYDERADEVRAALRRRSPDAFGVLVAPVRPAEAPEAATVTLGRGAVANPIRFHGGDGERARLFRNERRLLEDVPLTVPLADGVCVRGPRPVAEAVLRALVVQLCLRFPASRMRIVGEDLEALGVAGLPHAHGRVRGTWTVRVGRRDSADAVVATNLVAVGADEEPPSGLATVLDVTDPATGLLRTPSGDERCAVEAISAAQAEEIADVLRDAADAEPGLPGAVALAELTRSPAAPGSLGAVFGAGTQGEVAIDLAEDGPHALVTGMTGTGKSELLVSWLAALAASHGPEEVSFILADFKGGTAFERLRDLPHVAAIITDLDGDGAARGVRSLRAELRRRETELGACGARSIAEAEGRLSRLVIVVDEFAALLQEHPDLGAVFTDIAARGRALGMHLVLGTQRATGVVRDALAANCPLRLCLRVSDPADSRVMIGVDDAAELPGDAGGRGLVLVRRPQDTAPVLMRVGRTQEEDLRRIAQDHAASPRATSPWLPPLPTDVDAATLRAASPEAMPEEAVVLGLSDDPEHQRQPVVVLRPGHDRGLAVFGGPGAGRSTLVRTVIGQVPSHRAIPADPEAAWSIVEDLAEGRAAWPRALVCDDLDARLASFPAEYAVAWAERLQRVVRAAATRGCLVVFTASRSAGPVAALADLLPQRVVLRMPSRGEHLAAGGEPASFDPLRPDGRANLAGREIQIARLSGPAGHHGAGSATEEHRTPPWRPSAGVCGVIAPFPRRTAAALTSGVPGVTARTLDQIAPGTGVQDLIAPSRTLLLVGEAEAWQRHWSLWHGVRDRGEILVVAEAARELRTLVGVRDLPPYARPDAGRAWSIRDGRGPARVLLPLEADPARAADVPAPIGPPQTRRAARRAVARADGREAGGA